MRSASLLLLVAAVVLLHLPTGCDGRTSKKQRQAAKQVKRQQAEAERRASSGLRTKSSHAAVVLTKDECDQIVRESEEKLRDSETNTLDDSVRSSEVTALSPKKFKWVYDKMWAHLSAANEEVWGYSTLDTMEDIQIARYHSDRAGHYAFHPDATLANKYAGSGADRTTRAREYNRLLSASVQLTNPQAYAGGDLQIGSANATRDQGAVVVFPSYQLHRVHPVTSGERYSLVVWLHGEDAYGDYWVDAESSYATARHVEPHQTALRFAAHNALGTLYGSSNRFTEAIPVLHGALELNPTDSMSMNNLGVALAKTRRDAEAISLYSRAIDFAQNDPDGADGSTSAPFWALRGRGNALHRSARHAEAVADLAAAADISEITDETLLINLGLAQFSLSRDDAALENLQAAVDTHRLSASSIAVAHTTIAKLYQRQHKPTMAIGAASTAITAARHVKSRDSLAEPLQLRAYLLRDAGDATAALRDFRELKQLRPDADGVAQAVAELEALSS